MTNFGGGWDEELKPLFESEKFAILQCFLQKEYSNYTIYPQKCDIFNCFRYTQLVNIKAVILGQDPYFNPNQAHGLSFSVKDNPVLPPSLKNIYKELQSDLGITPNTCGNLTKWAQNGVLLLNAALTVREKAPNSHKNYWQFFTDGVIEIVNKNTTNTVFILWGNDAQKKINLIDTQKHLIIKSAHPSPLSASRGFFDSKPFSQANNYLTLKGCTPIDWHN